jgi:hypothetical protein
MNEVGVRISFVGLSVGNAVDGRDVIVTRAQLTPITSPIIMITTTLEALFLILRLPIILSPDDRLDAE